MLRFRPSSDYVNRYVQIKRWFTILGVSLVIFSIFFWLSLSAPMLIMALMVPLMITRIWIENRRWKTTMSFIAEEYLEIHDDFLSMVNPYGEKKIFFKDVKSVSQNLLNIELKLVDGERFVIHDFESPEIILAELSRRISA